MAVPTIDAVARCTEFAAAQARQAGFSLARVTEVELVVEEVVANICRHSYGEQPGEVELCCRRLDGSKMAWEFIDYGPPFDILASPAPDLSVDLDQRGEPHSRLPFTEIRRIVLALRAVLVPRRKRPEEALGVV